MINLNTLLKYFSDLKVESIISDSPGKMRLQRLIVDKKRRGRGLGTLFMLSMCVYADNNRKVIGISPSADWGTPIRRLKRFYRKFGFVDNKGSHRNKSICDDMYRLPRKINEHNNY
jgi:GNAT superfamily N-acetyltransferase